MPPRQVTVFPFPVEPGAAIRMGMDAIKNVGEGPIDSILSARGNRPFASLADFAERVDLRQINRRGLECLIKVGALDDFGERSRILAAIDQLMQVSASAHDAADAGQLTLFGEVESASDTDILAAAGPDHEGQQQRNPRVGEGVGRRVRLQPSVAADDGRLMNIVTHATVDITEELGKQGVVVAGMLAEVRTFTTKKGEQMAFCRLEDLQGSVDVTVFPQLFREKRDLWKQDKIVIVWGKADSRNGRMSIVADRVQDYVQGQRIIEDTSTTYHRFQNGNGQPVRPAVHGGNDSHILDGAVKMRFVPPPASRAVEDSDSDYGEPNPFAAQAPDWLADDAEPDESESIAAPLPAAPVQTESEGAASTNGSFMPAPAEERPSPSSESIRPAVAHEPPAAPHPQRLHLIFQRSHSLDADRRRLSDLVDLLEKYKGTDRFVIVIEASGHASYQLDFPNSCTRVCKELRTELTQRLGVNHWRLE